MEAASHSFLGFAEAIIRLSFPFYQRIPFCGHFPENSLKTETFNPVSCFLRTNLLERFSGTCSGKPDEKRLGVLCAELVIAVVFNRRPSQERREDDLAIGRFRRTFLIFIV
ncbi:hypothetical protein ACFSC6_08930 [Rufibacter sediminis]|uniref:Uncharacterized protein n=1 Tax=Rufibacter sediminis TaxID=2762756 RepID=A0ABR6VXQ2_9BACT|nr:hypothetical protein [Rufibacter sediminis]MBC3541984.1 hypothetical protein [Rufibacter sediminis]